MKTAASHRLLKQIPRCISTYGQIQADDHIMVGLSGGKDSYTLFDMLCRLRAKAPFDFKITGVHLDQGQPGYDGAPLEKWLEDFGEPYEIIRRDTYTKVIELTQEGKSFCAPCSRMRRGALYNVAERLGCNKIALGHHREDALETLLMNIFYSGKMQSMPARYKTQDGRFEVIRPMLECSEADIIEHAAAEEYPILPCNLCGSQSGMKREEMGDLISKLEEQTPDIRSNMFNAMRNIDLSRLLDPQHLQGSMLAKAQQSTNSPSGCSGMSLEDESV